jgi:hypothetical protein
VYISYFICTAIGCSSIVTILVLANKVEKPLLWLLSVVISVVVSCLVIEPAKIFLIALANSWMGNALDVDIHQHYHPCVDQSLAYPDDGLVGVWKEKRFLIHLVLLQNLHPRPLRGYALSHAKEESRKTSRLKMLIRHFIANFLLLWLLLSLNYAAVFNDTHRLITHMAKDAESHECRLIYDLQDNLK